MLHPAPAKPAASRAWIITAMVFVLAFDLAFVWQRRAGATASELGGHPGEAAHYITGLAVHNYLTHDLGSAPRQSLKNFAAHFPIVRTNAWPPLFPIAQAAWTSAFGKSRTSVLLMMCALAGIVALLLHLALREEFGDATGVVAVVLFLSLPIVREHYSTVVPEMLCTVWMFAAMLAFTRFKERKRMADAVWFCLLAGLAILTGRAGFALVLFVPLALPFPARLARYSTAAALISATALSALFAPGDFEPRHLLPALPAAMLFVVAGCAALAQRTSRSTTFILLIAGVLTIALFETVAPFWRVKKWSGFRPLAEIILQAEEHPNARVLICSDRTGDGMFISEIAMGETRPVRIIARAETLLANTKFTEDEDLSNLLFTQHFDYVVFDESNPDLDHSPQQDILRRVLRGNSDRFWEMSSSSVIRDAIPQDAPARLYRVTRRDY